MYWLNFFQLTYATINCFNCHQRSNTVVSCKNCLKTSTEQQNNQNHEYFFKKRITGTFDTISRKVS